MARHFLQKLVMGKRGDPAVFVEQGGGGNRGADASADEGELDFISERRDRLEQVAEAFGLTERPDKKDPQLAVRRARQRHLARVNSVGDHLHRRLEGRRVGEALLRKTAGRNHEIGQGQFFIFSRQLFLAVGERAKSGGPLRMELRFLGLILPHQPPMDDRMLVDALQPVPLGGAKSRAGSAIVGIDRFDR